MSSASSPAHREPSRRAFTRHPLSVPLDLKALQSGIPEDLPGRCTDISETGLGAIIAGELSLGQQVAIELRLPMVGVPVRARAIVRHQSKLQCGLELVGFPADQREMIRYWIQQRKIADYRPAERSFSSNRGYPSMVSDGDDIGDLGESPLPSTARAPHVDNRIIERLRSVNIGARIYGVVILVVAVFAIGWVRWERSWRELERPSTANAIIRVSEETMASRILTRVEPVYPETVQKSKVEGPVVLDAVIAANGSVESVRSVSGPEALIPAATAAVAAWKFEPYQSEGKLVPVETTISIDFHAK